ncbi:hypothetical protein AVEN_233865-1 [Araneus ventricosus]|uniref:Uncharacterized protein n=1 Tax=Araneus ventricosus TaxID=182803 RepID=A0A4Y2MML3_ARAVE|nr:hypothetical protein AVEN_233865-1 [Araneus ventricosus]
MGRAVSAKGYDSIPQNEMSAHNGPNAVEEKCVRSTFQNKRGLSYLPAQSREQDLRRCRERDPKKTCVVVSGYADAFELAFLKPNGL